MDNSAESQSRLPLPFGGGQQPGRSYGLCEHCDADYAEALSTPPANAKGPIFALARPHRAIRHQTRFLKGVFNRYQTQLMQNS